MNDANKTKQQLINELEQACQRIAELQASETQPKRAEEELKKSTELFEAVFSSQLDAIFVLDEASPPTIIDCNPAAGKIFGYAREEMVGQTTSFLHVNQETLKTFQSGLYPAIAETGLFYLADFYMKRKDGTVFPTEHSVMPLVNDKGERVGWVSVLRDITERKEAEEALRQSEERYRTVLDEMEDSYFEVDLSGHITFANESTCRNLRLSREELIGASYKTFSAEKSIEDVYKAFNEAYRTGKPIKSFSWEIVRGDGSTGFAETTVLLLHNQDGQIIGFRGIGRDITERKQVEQTLSHERELIQTIFENHPDFIYFKDREARFHRASKVFCDFFGLSMEDITGKTDLDLFPEEVAKQTYSEDLHIIKTGTPLINKEESAGGLWVLTTKIPWFDKEGNIVGLFGISRDITERKQAEEALRQSEERYRTILEEMEEGYYELDLNGNLTFCNDSYRQALGYSPEEITGMDYATLLAEADRDRMFEMFTDIYRKGKLIGSFTCQALRKDGGTVTVESAASPLRDEEGQIIGFRGVGRDITERKKVEEALRESEQKYRTIFETTSTAMLIGEEDTTISMINAEFEKLCGWSKDQVEGKKSWIEFIVKADLERMKEYNRLRIIDPNAAPPHYEFQFIDRYGNVKNIFITLALIPGTRKTVGSLLDITERKQLEEERKELEQKAHLASRLATVGQLASGVGHEINNPLTGVIGYSHLLLQKDIPEDIRKDVMTINEGAQRVANIVKKLVAFARYQKPERTYASTNDTLATTLDLLAHQLETSNIKTNLHLDPNLPWTMADIGQLQQVFLNIVINAETEMRLAHGKGKLSIKTEKADNTIRICFQDNGPGIAEGNLEKIFDPFFTTREVGQGTGLGLSICHEIITEHNGRLYAQSEPGKGATFIVELPVVTEEQQAQAPEPVAEEAVKVARARILVVDDEPVILDFVSRVLSDEGHEVETVANAKDALKKIKSERYGLILLDMKLPGMRGDELYKRIQRIAGSLTRRVVFITGDVLGPDTMDFIARTEAPCVTKPFDAEQLKKAVNTILAEGA